MTKSLIYSLIFHSVMILLTVLTLPFMIRQPIDLPPIVSVELIQISDKTNIPFAPKARKIIKETKENKNRTCFNNYSISHNKKFDDRWIILCTDRFNNLLSLRHKKYKILCFMWHPERDFTDHDLVKSIIN